MADVASEFQLPWYQKRTDEELRDIRKIMSEMVPRAEHEVRWKNENLAADRVQKQLDEVTKSIHELAYEVRSGHKELQQAVLENKELINEHEKQRLRAQLPKWFLPMLAVCTPIITAIVVHFVK